MASRNIASGTIINENELTKMFLQHEQQMADGKIQKIIFILRMVTKLQKAAREFCWAILYK